MATEEETKHSVTLRIHSETTSIETITGFLKIEPDGAVIKGSKAAPNNPKSYIRPANMWQLESDIERTEPFENHITRIVEFIESRESALRELIRTCEIDIFCGYFPSDYTQ
jgi:hypothetical protein